MAPATALPASVDEHPLVVPALRRSQEIDEEMSRIDARHKAAHEIGGYTNVFTNDPLVSRTPEEIMLARQELQDLPRERIGVRRRQLEAQRMLAEARDLARADLSAAIDRERRPLVAKLDAALATAAKHNEALAAWDDRAQAMLGTMAPRFSWHELGAEMPNWEPRLAAWRRSCREHGMLE